MVKLFTDEEVDVHCKLWRPIPLYLQQAVLAVPNGIRNNPYTDLPDISKDNYVAPQSVHVMAINAKSMFGIDPNAYINAYNKLIDREMKTNEIELDINYGTGNSLFSEFEGVANGGNSMFETLAEIDSDANILMAKQTEALRRGVGLFGDGGEDAADMPMPSAKRTREERRETFMRSVRSRFGDDAVNQAISRNIQSELIPGLVTQTKVDDVPGVEESKSEY